MVKARSWKIDGESVPLRLTFAQYRALQATARGEVYRTHNSIAYTLTGPCSSVPLWAVARAKLIADPPQARQHGRMVLTAKGRAALEWASAAFGPNRKPQPPRSASRPRIIFASPLPSNAAASRTPQRPPRAPPEG